MKKIVLLPLDERPCNYLYPLQMFNNDDIKLVLPSMDIMGDKKTPANHEALEEFLLKETKDAFGLVISIDTLLYGGIVPSRLHYHSEEELKRRMSLITTLKNNNPDLLIYAFDLIMRCPQYSSDDEEPTYYKECGLEIFKTGYLSHKKELNVISKEELEVLENLQCNQDHLNDYLARRELNCKLNIETLNLVENNTIDFLIIPQDDASEYGWTAIDQIKIRKVIDEKCLQLDVYMYPGADEVANNLISKMVLKIKNQKPLFYIKYPSPNSPLTVPALEDRYLDTTVRYQILSSGGLITTSVKEADIVLFVNTSATRMVSSADFGFPRDRGMSVLRNMPEFVEFMDYCVNTLNKDVVVADVATLNGGDYELIKMMQKRNLLMKVAAYAGWNTSSNTLGTCIPHGIMTHVYGRNQEHYNFLVSRYIEDFCYMSYVRAKVNRTLGARGMNYFSIDGQRGVICNEVKEELVTAVEQYLPTLKGHFEIEDCYMPWRRMFEVGLIIKYVK